MIEEFQLGKRLGTIAKLIIRNQQYDHIWDCCCDHGYLGMFLLNHFSTQKGDKAQINFVDQVAHITEQLRTKLAQNTPTHYEVHTLNAECLELSTKQRHCVIIAGVTTTGTLKILQTLLNKHPNQCIDFILCPTRGQYELRKFLIKEKACLIEENHIIENNRHYELLYIRMHENQQQNRYQLVSSIGAFWQKDNEEHIRYLISKLSHYRKEMLGVNKLDAIEAVQLYSDMQQKISSAKL